MSPVEKEARNVAVALQIQKKRTEGRKGGKKMALGFEEKRGVPPNGEVREEESYHGIKKETKRKEHVTVR